MGQLAGRVAVITGGARGQGRSHAVTLAAEGADIVVCDISEPIGSVPYPLSSEDDLSQTVKLVEETGRRCVAVQADVRSRAAMDGPGHYAAAKWGVIGLVKSLAHEVIPHGITVNAVLPAGVRTDMIMNPAMYSAMVPDIENPTLEDVEAMFAAGPPNGDLIVPQEVSQAILLLVGESGRHFNGEAITISGGRSAGTI